MTSRAYRPPKACDLSLLAARNVRWLRKARGWTVKTLAENTGISWQMVAALENGRRNFTLPVLSSTAEALGVTPADLLASPAAKLASAPGKITLTVSSPPGLSPAQVSRISDAFARGFGSVPLS